MGSFLRTSDIRLYSTFGVPLVHGWIAPPSSETNAALSRVAQYHEDIQLLQFQKTDLEQKVVQGGILTPQEEELIRDIQTIQQFTEIENPTQLSIFGLEQLKEKLIPGSVAILFRNDHFSTLYKHPTSGQLFSLVTDAGYASHQEIVWENLVDVKGAKSELFSGDFLPVGNNPSTETLTSDPRTANGTTNQQQQREEENKKLTPQEQADADYAYALSLQFQEEERNSNNNNGRDRSSSTPLRPPRSRNTTNRLSTSRQLGLSGNGNGNGNEELPPSFEEATDGHSHSHSQSHFQSQSQSRQSRQSRARSSTGPSSKDRDKNGRDCIVM